MASAVVRNDEVSSLLDGDEWSPPVPVPAARLPPSPATPSRLHGKAAATRPERAVTGFMCSPFAAIFRTCARASAISTSDEQQPSSNGAAGAERRPRRGARRRPSLEQLLRMEAPPPPSLSPARPAWRGKGPSPALVKEEEEPFSYIIVAPDEEEHAAAVPAAAELEPAGGRQSNAKRLVVVVFASLRACSRPPRINSGAASRAPGKAELFYYRPIPMGRRCRVQHLEESPYK
ncbi:hypothetical protein BS78_03G119200 [Paspalum vaginatum]|uniref:Uncharacterized protein n=1 Tax=Paspalum vaginatum TaxID=158149 RepID=A0A9W7X824_9POAL|nr:hypothetical protein BS78_K297000 [Paspalum vaginatum]KAJ1283316.1 hypothetical protein BS78_03G119200 [Paspalum vaginatum]